MTHEEQMKSIVATLTEQDDLDLDTLSKLACDTATAKGFTDASIPEDIALMHSELSEMLEDFRAGKLAREMMYEQKVFLPTTIVDNIQSFLSSIGLSAPPQVRFTTVLTTSRVAPDGTLNKPVGMPSELADVIVRVLHFCGKHGVPIGHAVREKMLYNASRPFKHGGKK